MKKINFKFYILFGIVFLVAILTPHIVHGHIFISEKYAESAILFLDIILAYVFYLMYKREMKKADKEKRKTEEDLLDSYKYIGKANVHASMLRKFVNFISLRYCDKKKFNEKKVFNNLLSIIVVSFLKVNNGAVRFIDKKSGNTVGEFFYNKSEQEFKIKLSNNEIIHNKIISNKKINIIKSDYKNGEIICVFYYNKNINEEVDVNFLKTLINQMHLLFLSNYHKH